MHCFHVFILCLCCICALCWHTIYVWCALTLILWSCSGDVLCCTVYSCCLTKSIVTGFKCICYSCDVDKRPVGHNVPCFSEGKEILLLHSYTCLSLWLFFHCKYYQILLCVEDFVQEIWCLNLLNIWFDPQILPFQKVFSSQSKVLAAILIYLSIIL